MKSVIKYASIMTVILLAGCATSQYEHQSHSSNSERAETIGRYLKSGQCNLAEKEIINLFDDLKRQGHPKGTPDNKFLLLGMNYNYCKKNKAKAYEFLTLSARYGNSDAIELLAKEGQPIPTPDLRTTKTYSQPQQPQINPFLELFGAAVIGASEGVTEASKSQRTRQTNCYTDKRGYTDCTTY